MNIKGLREIGQKERRERKRGRGDEETNHLSIDDVIRVLCEQAGDIGGIATDIGVEDRRLR